MIGIGARQWRDHAHCRPDLRARLVRPLRQKAPRRCLDRPPPAPLHHHPHPRTLAPRPGAAGSASSKAPTPTRQGQPADRPRDISPTHSAFDPALLASLMRGALPLALPGIFAQGYRSRLPFPHGTAGDGDDRQGYRGPAAATRRASVNSPAQTENRRSAAKPITNLCALNGSDPRSTNGSVSASAEAALPASAVSKMGIDFIGLCIGEIDAVRGLLAGLRGLLRMVLNSTLSWLS
jgi:hypothetical protein